MYVTVGPDDDRIDAELVLHRGLWIAGQVLDPERHALGEIIVAYEAVERKASGHTSTDEEGRFELGPLVPGRHKLLAIDLGKNPSNWAPSEPLVVEAGARDLELLLRHGGELRLRLIDSLTGEAVPGAAYVAGVDHAGTWISGPMVEVLTIPGLGPGRYHVTGHTRAGLVGHVRDLVVAAGEVTEFDLPVTPGGALEVHYRGPLNVAYYRIERAGARLASDGLESGSSATRVVPAGELEVVLTLAHRDGEGGERRVEEHRRSVAVERGERVVVRFELGE